MQQFYLCYSNTQTNKQTDRQTERNDNYILSMGNNIAEFRYFRYNIPLVYNRIVENTVMPYFMAKTINKALFSTYLFISDNNKINNKQAVFNKQYKLSPWSHAEKKKNNINSGFEIQRRIQT